VTGFGSRGAHSLLHSTGTGYKPNIAALRRSRAATIKTMLIKTILKMAYIMLMTGRMEEYRQRLTATSSPDGIEAIKAELWPARWQDAPLDHMRRLELTKDVDREMQEWYG
jgi:hypothetical protein